MKPTKDQTPDTKDSSLVQLTTIRKKASPSDVRLSNRMMVFSQLFPHHVMSRADIVRNTGLSKASASEIVSNMVACHILAEIGQEPQEGRGKRGTCSASTHATGISSPSISLNLMSFREPSPTWLASWYSGPRFPSPT